MTTLRHGFTLIETLLYAFFLGIMVLAFAGFLPAVYDARARRQVVEEVDAQAGQALQILTQTVRNANAITSPAPGASSSTIVLAVAEPSKNPTRFSLANGALTMKEGSGATISLTNAYVTTTALSFANLTGAKGDGTVGIRFSMNYASSSQRQAYQYQNTYYATAALR